MTTRLLSSMIEIGASCFATPTPRKEQAHGKNGDGIFTMAPGTFHDGESELIDKTEWVMIRAFDLDKIEFPNPPQINIFVRDRAMPVAMRAWEEWCKGHNLVIEIDIDEDTLVDAGDSIWTAESTRIRRVRSIGIRPGGIRTNEDFAQAFGIKHEHMNTDDCVVCTQEVASDAKPSS